MVKMDKTDLKKILKPLMKECIREVLMEQGLSTIITEMVSKPVQQIKSTPEAQTKQVFKKEIIEQKPQLNEARKAMLDSIGKSGYMSNKFDPFSGTAPLTEVQAADGNISPTRAAIDSAVLNDPGVDISSLMGNKNAWKALIGGKGK